MVDIICCNCAFIYDEMQIPYCPRCRRMSPNLIAFYDGQEPGRDYERELGRFKADAELKDPCFVPYELPVDQDKG
jgi:hypothetical protein